jgi:hypothetical protein
MSIARIPLRLLFSAILTTVLGWHETAQAESSAEVLAVQVKLISLSQDTATKLCPPPGETSVRSTVEIKGAIKAELPALIKRVSEAGGDVAAKYESTTSQGVLAGDLAGVITSANECRVKAFTFLTSILLGGPPPVVPVNQPISRTTPVVVSQAPEPNVSPLPKDGPTIRIFPKANLTQREMIALAKLLPTYSIQSGRSNIDAENNADTLYVNRDRVTAGEVISTLSALAQLGVPIKSVQQAPVGGRREMQVGTALTPDNGDPVFEAIQPINIEKLSHMGGIEFWKNAYNGGPVMCIRELGWFDVCHMDMSGRPVRDGR